MRIDINNWGEFEVGSLFDIHPTKAYKLTNNSLLSEDGVNPVIVNSSYNNGVGGYTNMPVTEEGRIITFSDTSSVDAVFYQSKPFVGYPHVQGMYPIGRYKNDWSENSLLFFTVVFKNKARGLGFNYVNKFTRESAAKMIVKLPINREKNIDFLYMENFIRAMSKKAKIRLKTLFNTSKTEKMVNIDSWKKFHLYGDNLFEIDMGSKLDKAKMTEVNPSINFVGRANANNGITTSVDAIDGLSPYNAGYMTVSLGGEYLGSCFVQPKPFYTSQNVIVLIPKWDMPFEVKQFIATMVFKESQTYYKAFVDELNRHIKTDFSFWLPVTSKGTPDWSYMERYMKFKINVSKLYLQKIQGHIK